MRSGETGADAAERLRRDWGLVWRHPVVIAVVAMTAAAIVWVTVFPRMGTDLSAGITRAGWARHYPGTGYVFSWYGGTYPASYSVLAPYLLALTGVRLGMAASAVLSAGLLAALFMRSGTPRPRAAALWGVAGVATQLSSGRASFALGLAAALGCLATLGSRGLGNRARWLAAAGLALLTSLLSSVAGLFLGVPAAALLLTRRRRDGLAVGLAAGAPLAVAGLLLRGDVQPIGVQNGLPSLLAAVLVVCFVPARWRAVRVAAAVYGVAVILVWALPTPVGSNVERLGELLIGPVLAGMGVTRHRRLFALGLAWAAGWLMAHPTVDFAYGNAPPYAPQTAALVRELQALDANTARVEAVPQYGHWESQELVPTVWLARGWERQTDIADNPLFYNGSLTPAAYLGWLRTNAVRYVAISSGSLDWSAGGEAAIVRAGQPWLVPVWHNSFWRLYRVTGAQPLASPPGVVTATTPAQLTVEMSRGGTTIVRVHWSPLLRSTGGAILARHGGWTSLTAAHSGTYILTAPY